MTENKSAVEFGHVSHSRCLLFLWFGLQMTQSFSFASFYKKLGNLYFAIAASDNNISKKEKTAIEEVVYYHWKHLENSTDRFGTDAAYFILFQFETLADGVVHPQSAYQSFAHFFSENQDQIDHWLRKRIFDSAKHIAEAVRGVNEKEMHYLLKLKDLLQL